jgi:hypothetical protein
MTIRSTITMLTLAAATLAANVVFTASDADARVTRVGGSSGPTRVTGITPPPLAGRNGQGNVTVTTTPRTPRIICKGWTCPTVVKSSNRDHRRR